MDLLTPETALESPWDDEKNGSMIPTDGSSGDAARVESKGQYGELNIQPTHLNASTHPHNWPRWRKNTLLLIVAIHTMQPPFSAAIAIPAFMQFSVEFGVKLNTAAYMTSVPWAFLAITPSIWWPVSARLGRRPVYLVSALVSSGCALAGSFCQSYATLMITRIIQAIFLAPVLSIGACTVEETFSSYERGRRLGIWALMATIGPSLGPVTVGYLVQSKGWRAAFRLLAAIHLALFVAHIALGPETLLPNPRMNTEEQATSPPPRNSWRYYVYFRIYDRTPLQAAEFTKPFLMLARPAVLLPALAYAIVFSYTTVLVIILVPQIFGREFGLAPGPIGLQMVAQFIGAIFGQLLSGWGSDIFVNQRTKRTGNQVAEYRLMLVYPGFLFSIIGLILWGVQLQNATPGKWNISPDIGAAIATFGQQMVATICTTYAIECYISETAAVSAFLSFCRHFLAFLTTFYIGDAVTHLGVVTAVVSFSGIMAIGMLMVLASNIWGQRWRNG